MPDISSSEHPSLYRAIKSRRWIAQRSAAFILRQNENGLSVIFAANCRKTVCDAQQGTCFGELALQTLAVLSNGWKVSKDAPNHGEIVQLPLFGTDEAAIQDAAQDLADLVTSFQPRPTIEESVEET